MCKICGTDIENEIHFLCVCPKYKTLRVQFFGEGILGIETGKKILRCEEKEVSLNLANYIQKALKEREPMLNVEIKT